MEIGRPRPDRVTCRPPEASHPQLTLRVPDPRARQCCRGLKWQGQPLGTAVGAHELDRHPNSDRLRLNPGWPDTVSLRGINRRSEWRGSPAPCHAGVGPNTGRGWKQPVCPKSGAPDLTWSEQPGSSPTVSRAPREFGSFSRGWAGSGAQLGLGGTKGGRRGDEGYPEQTCSPGEPGSSLKN